MTTKVECPECGGTDWANPKYIKNAYVSFMAEGKCISCGFNVDAEYLLNLVHGKLQDLYVVREDSPRFNHDESLQEETLRDYPLYEKVLKKALDLCGEKDDQMRKQISGILGMVYDELAWYAKNIEHTHDYFNLSQRYFDMEEGRTPWEERTKYNLSQFLWQKSKLKWCTDKLGLLKEAYKITKTIGAPDQDEFIEWHHGMGRLSFDYGIALGDDPLSKVVMQDALDLLQHSTNIALEFGVSEPLGIFDKNFYVCSNYQTIANIYDFLQNTSSAYAYAVLAEQYSTKVRIIGEEWTKSLSAYRKKLEDKLSGDSIAEAIEMAQKTWKSLEHISYERKADASSLNSLNRILSLLASLKKTLPSCYCKKLENFSPSDPQEPFNVVRRIIEQYEKEVYQRLFGDYPKGPVKEWSGRLFSKLKESQQYPEILFRFIYRFASEGSHDSSHKFGNEDLELLYASLLRFMNWFHAFVNRLDGEPSRAS